MASSKVGDECAPACEEKSRLIYPSQEPTASRPISSSSLPVRQSTSRTHSHSVSLGVMNSNHRISRRKSVTNNNAAALAAAMKDGDASALSTSASAHRRSLGSRKGFESTSMGNSSGFGAYLARQHEADRAVLSAEDDALTESGALEKPMKQRNRRASDGAYLSKGEGKRVSDGELKCDTCGKGYKHSSCLTKHMWEHDPAWAVTSKLLISKHQQVQLLEAASVLVNMNQDTVTEEAFATNESDGSSASPGFSGSSEYLDELSSTETTPPPTSESAYSVPDHKRYSNSSYARSYHSTSVVGSVPSPGLMPQRGSVDHRPTTSGTDDTTLAAAAAELLIFGTPRSRATAMSPDVPPVPPLPERFQHLSGSSATPTVYNPLSMHPAAPTHRLSDERAVKDEEFSVQDERHDAHMDEDEDGVFGRMEE